MQRKQAKAIAAAGALWNRKLLLAVTMVAIASAMALQSPSVHAQSVDADTAEEIREEASSENDAVRVEPVAEKKEVPTPPKKTKASIKAQSAENADSYEATEEISEDLSVSYPVDI